MKGAMARAEEILARLGDRAWDAATVRQPRQSRHPLPHHGPEIWRTRGKVDGLRSGVGTGGTITAPGGSSRAEARIHIVAVEPAESPVLSAAEPRRIAAGHRGRVHSGPARHQDLHEVCG